LAADALRVLAENGINQILVTEDGRLAGLLSRSDVIRYIQFREELGIVGVGAMRR
jgi:CBS domain-containing protein